VIHLAQAEHLVSAPLNLIWTHCKCSTHCWLEATKPYSKIWD